MNKEKDKSTLCHLVECSEQLFLRTKENYELKRDMKKLLEALEFYASINADIPSAALAVDKFGMARKALREYKSKWGEG
jgi:hypothetical protein